MEACQGLLLCLAVSAVAGQVVLVHPADRTVFQDDRAHFSCITRKSSYTTLWRLNETDYDNLSNQVHDDLYINGTETESGAADVLELTILARVEYNGTRVQCVAENDDDNSVVSNTAMLGIQGLLVAVSNLKFSRNGSSLTISWSAPFSLDVTDVDPDIWYTVLIYNVTDNPTAIPCTDCINITETHYTFTPDHPSPCHKYNFTIIPLNGAGQGHGSKNITGYTTKELPFDISFRSDIVIEDDGENYIATVNFLGDIESVCTFAVKVLEQDVSFCSSSQFSNGTVVFKIPHESVKPSREYEIFFEISNALGSINTSTTTFKTSACQDATAHVNRKILNIWGKIMPKSTARGCFFYLNGGEDHSVAVQRITDSVFYQTHYDNFRNICVYDIEENGLPSRVPALTITLTLKDSQSQEPSSEVPSLNSSDILLSRAEMNRSGLNVFISCQVTSGASCVLVYQNNNTLLTAEEYNDSTIFPVSLTVDEETTLFLFGKSDALQSEPTLILRGNETHALYEPREPDDNTDGATSNTITVTLVSVTCSMALVIACVLSVLLAVACLRRSKKVSPPTKDHPGTPEAEEGVDAERDFGSSNYTSNSTVTQPLSQGSGLRPQPSQDQTVNYEQTGLFKATMERGQERNDLAHKAHSKALLRKRRKQENTGLN